MAIKNDLRKGGGLGEEGQKIGLNRGLADFPETLFWSLFTGCIFLVIFEQLWRPSGSQGVPKVSILGAKRCPKSVKNLTFCKTRES